MKTIEEIRKINEDYSNLIEEEKIEWEVSYWTEEIYKYVKLNPTQKSYTISDMLITDKMIKRLIEMGFKAESQKTYYLTMGRSVNEVIIEW